MVTAQYEWVSEDNSYIESKDYKQCFHTTTVLHTQLSTSSFSLVTKNEDMINIPVFFTVGNCHCLHNYRCRSKPCKKSFSLLNTTDAVSSEPVFFRMDTRPKDEQTTSNPFEDFLSSKGRPSGSRSSAKFVGETCHSR